MPTQQFIPVGQIPRDMLVLCNALAVVRVVAPPVGQRVYIEILSIEIDALARDQLVHMVYQPLPGRGVAQVEQSPTTAPQHPLRMRCGQPGAGSHAFRFKPDDGLDALEPGTPPQDPP